MVPLTLPGQNGPSCGVGSTVDKAGPDVTAPPLLRANPGGK